MAKSLNFKNLQTEQKSLDVPPLEEVAKALSSKLADNFAEVNAEVVECPDLTKAPFNLAAKGLCGNASVIEIGGPSFLLPLVQRDRIYDMKNIPELVGDKESFVIGAGAGPWPHYGVNCEMVINTVLSKDKVLAPNTRTARLVNGKPAYETVPENESRVCLLANLFSSQGASGKVVKVHCKKRSGDKDFVTALRTSLAAAFPDKSIGVGAAFAIVQGKAKQHIMPDFSKVPINSDDELNKWLTFHEHSAPLSAVGTFVTKDPGLDLRVQHFHSFGKEEAGHYHYDTTPESVEYLAYLSLGTTIYRIDKPEVNRGIGFD